MSNAWVIGSIVTPSFLGLLHKTSSLMQGRGYTTDAIMTDVNLSGTQAGILKSAGARRVYQLPLKDRDLNSEAQAVSALTAFYAEETPDYILFESSVFFSSVAPSFAAAIDCGITADCTELSWDKSGNLLLIRPAFGGRKIASNINVKGTSIATVRKGVFHLILRESISESEFQTVPFREHKNFWTLTECLSSITGTDSSYSLQDASVILSGGLGMGSRRNYARLYHLAGLIGAAAGASRAAVAAGFVGYDHQVGQTGVSVRPDLYIAFGISGAVQHLSGMIGSKKIIAVNSDPNAPIHRYSDFSVIADCNVIIDKLIERLERIDSINN